MELPGKIHATSIYLPAANLGGERGVGVLLAGPSGSGKSDMALRLIDGGALLISDDYTLLEDDGGAVVASAPDEIAGLLEIRGLGIIRLDAHQLKSRARVNLFVQLVPEGQRGLLSRMPGLAFDRIGHHDVMSVALCGFDAVAPAKLRAAARLALDPARRIE